MREIKRGDYVRARVWLDELPRATFSPKSLHTFTWKCQSVAKPRLRSLAVECFAYVGPRIYYGLLGGAWESAETGQFKVVVGTSEGDGERLDESIGAGKSWPAFVGFPSEYLEGVELGFAAATLFCPSGTLTLNCAAHEHVGSCIVIYERIAASIARMLSGATTDTANEELARMIWPDFYGVKS